MLYMESLREKLAREVFANNGYTYTCFRDIQYYFPLLHTHSCCFVCRQTDTEHNTAFQQMLKCTKHTHTRF